MYQKVLSITIAASVAAFLQTALRAAEPAETIPTEKALREDLEALRDPTIMNRRVWLETEWNNYKGGSNNVEETLGGLWACGVSTNQDVGLRLKLPYEWHIAGGTPGESNEHGLGDIKFATGTAVRFGEKWRAAGGLELRMPTHSDGLGDNDWRLQEFAAVAWNATPWLTFSPSAEYNESLAVVRGGSWQNYIEIYGPATLVLPHLWSFTAQYEAKINFEQDNYLTNSGKLQIGKQFVTQPMGLSLSIKKPFDGGNKKFQVNFLITYYFR